MGNSPSTITMVSSDAQGRLNRYFIASVLLLYDPVLTGLLNAAISRALASCVVDAGEACVR